MMNPLHTLEHSEDDDNNKSTDEMETHLMESSTEGITYHSLGDSNAPISYEDEEIVFNTGRIKKIRNLENCKKVKNLSLIAQLIEKIENLDTNTSLEHLELYQNQIKKIENINHLINLKVLDVSFNEVRKIEGIDKLVNLEKLFLSSNKITKIEELDTLTKLVSLELGANRIRVIENLDKLISLKELWLGKNKISLMAIPQFPCLTHLSIQSNRLTQWDLSIVFNAPNIEELYLSHNQLTTIPKEIKNLKKLRTLDLAGNQISSLSSLSGCENLEELWFNDNLISSKEELEYLTSLKNLETVYLERNPIQILLGPGYRTTIIDVLPWIKQLDALVLYPQIPVTVHRDKGVKSAMK